MERPAKNQPSLESAVEIAFVPTQDFENRIVRLIAQLLAIDEALAPTEDQAEEEKTA